MSDAHITLSYVLSADSSRRAEDFILYGLGQEKLSIAHIDSLIADGSDETLEELADVKRSWLNCQRHEFLTVVNVGSATGLNARQMAESCGLKDLYDFNFSPFSASVHSTWQHVGRFNLEPCANPLHGHHLVPYIESLPNTWHEPRVAIKTLRLSLEAVDQFLNLDATERIYSAWEYWY